MCFKRILKWIVIWIYSIRFDKSIINYWKKNFTSLSRNKISIIYLIEVKYLDNEKAWKDLSHLSRRFYKPIVFLPFQGNQVTIQLTIVIANKNDVCYWLDQEKIWITWFSFHENCYYLFIIVIVWYFEMEMF